MSKNIFITGTGTDVGKTFVTALIVKKLRDNGIDCGYYKSALSGTENINGFEIPGDADYVCRISGLKESYSDIVSYMYKNAVSPHLAAQIEGNPVCIEKVKNDFEKCSKRHDYMIVEGSGGIVCPIREDDNQRIVLTDIIKNLGLDIIIVANAGLGTINAVVLTVEYARQLGINIRGIILNKLHKNSVMEKDNKLMIEKYTGIKVAACVEDNAKDIDIDIDILKSLFS